MALKVLMLNNKLRAEEANLTTLRGQLAGFATRETELATMIEQATTEEERSAVEREVETFESERSAAQTAVTACEQRISDLRASIAEAEAAQAAATSGEQQRSAAPAGGRTMELREAQEFQRTGRHSYRDVRSILRAAPLKTTSTGVIGPVDVSGVNEGFVGVSSLIDLIKVTDCTGMSSYKVAYLAGDAADAAAITEGSAPTEGEPSFGSVELTPTNYGTIGYISKEIRKQSPLNYEEQVRLSARRSLRRKMNNVAVTAITASTLNDKLTLTGAKGADMINHTLLSEIILAYGGDEELGGAGVLFLAKEDLRAFAAVRGKNEYLPVYSIVPDASNPNTGVIKDNNGLSCRYCISKDVTALSTLTPTASAKTTMFYGNPACAEMALWGGFDVEVNDGYKFAEGLLTVRGEVTGDVEVTVKGGFVVVEAKTA